MRPSLRTLFISILALPCSVLGDSMVGESPTKSPASFELFSARDQWPTRLDGLSADSAAVRVWVLDGIDRLETTLSRALPTDRQKSQREVLNRLQNVNEDWHRQVNDSAKALLRALELGVDRYPAVVFDERLVVYGLTDLGQATLHYRQWQEQHQP